jgi:predicted RNA-binding Zn-ribbon protein involved in translation (DUF1610 family)
MLAALGNIIVCGLLNLLRGLAVAVPCPKCGTKFKPFAEHGFTHVSQIMGRFPCPKCGHQFAIGEDAKSRHEDAGHNPPGPLSPPADTRIERRTPSDHELLFYLPPSGKAGFLAVFGAIWSAMMLPLFYFLVIHGGAASQLPPPLGMKVFISVFAAVGLGLIYGALRQKYGSHLLYLSSELIRMQRLLLFRATYNLKPADVLHVKLVESYSTNNQKVYGIEIGAGLRLIRFGSALRDDEKQWLAWEIRNFLRQHGATQLPEESKR